MRDRNSQVFLLISSVVSLLGFFLLYVYVRIVSFVPTTDDSWLLPHQRWFWVPEIEVPLYIQGVIGIFGGGVLLYCVLLFLFQLSPSRNRPEKIELFMRVVALLDFVLFGSMILMPGLWRSFYFQLIIGSLAVWIGTLWVLFGSGLRDRVWEQIKHWVDWSAILVGNSISALLLYSIMFTETYRVGRSNDYLFFRGFTRIDFLAMSAIVICLILIWIHSSHIKMSTNIKRGVLLVAHTATILFIVYATTTVSSSRFDDDIYFMHVNTYAIASPVNDVLGGKTLLVDAMSQYGLLHIYALSLIYAIVPLTFTHFFWVTMAITLIGMLLLYAGLWRWLGGMSIVAMVLVFEHYYFAASTNYTYAYSLGFGRWVFWIVILAIISRKDRIPQAKRWSMHIERLLVAVAFFWAFDVGTYVLTAYLIYSFVSSLFRSNSLAQFIKTMSVGVVQTGIYLLLVFAGISVYTFLRSGQVPDWSAFVFFSQYYTQGFSALPMPLVGPYVVVLVIYAIVTIYITAQVVLNKNNIDAKESKDFALATFVCSTGWMQFLYYANRSTDSSLHVVSLPAIVLFCWLTIRGKQWAVSARMRDWRQAHRYLFITYVLLGFIAFSLLTTIAANNLKNALGSRVHLFDQQLDAIDNDPPMRQSTEAINNHLEGREQPLRKITILSNLAGYFLIKTQSVNMIGYNNMDTLFTVYHIQTLLEQLVALKPEVLFVDHERVDNVVALFEPVKNEYRLVGSFGVLDKWERIL